MATKNSIVKPAEIVPQLDQSSLRVALDELQDELACVPEWTAKAKALVVTNAAEYKDAGEFRAKVRSQKKIPRLKLEFFQEVAKKVTDFLKMRRYEAELQFEAIDALITAKMDEHARQERLAAEAEQRRINEERQRRANEEAARLRKEAEAQAEADRKKREKEIAEAKRAGEVSAREAERLKKEAKAREDIDKQNAKEAQLHAPPVQEVEVKPSLPTIAGSRRHVNYFAEFVDFDRLLYKWCYAVHNGDQGRATYLRKFITGNVSELMREARDEKDSKALEAKLPGVHAWDKDVT